MSTRTARYSSLALLGGIACAQAQSADALIDKLLEKGILTTEEAKELRKETDDNFTASYRVKSGMPEWVTALRINGDFRGRFEGFYSDNAAFVDRNRFRYRLRLGVTAVMRDQLEVGLRLGSGDLEGIRELRTGTDPISSNQSFQNNASKKGVFLDLAYAKWSPLDLANWSGNLTIGKMENPFVFSDALFDRDYTPEGASIGLAYQFAENQSLALNTGGFVLDEISDDSDDPHLVGAQLRWDAKWSPRISTTAGVAGMVIGGDENLKNSDVPNINAGNTRTPLPDGALVHNYNPIVVDAAITYTLRHFPSTMPRSPSNLRGIILTIRARPTATGPTRSAYRSANPASAGCGICPTATSTSKAMPGTRNWLTPISAPSMQRLPKAWASTATPPAPTSRAISPGQLIAPGIPLRSLSLRSLPN